MSKPEYVWDPNRRDWENGYHRDMAGRYHPLNGTSPDQLGNGGGTPRIYFKVESAKKQTEDDQSS